MNQTAWVRIGLGLGAALCGLSGFTGLRAQETATVDVSGYPSDVQKRHKLFAAKCSRCHDLSRALTARYTTPAQWKDLVERMARRPGAGISPLSIIARRSRCTISRSARRLDIAIHRTPRPARIIIVNAISTTAPASNMPSLVSYIRPDAAENCFSRRYETFRGRQRSNMFGGCSPTNSS